MSVLGSYRLFNRLDNGSLTGAQLETLLAGSRELAEFKQLCDTPQAATALAASPTAVAAIGQSAIATQVVYDNRRNFDVLARQRLSAGSVTFLEQFFLTQDLLTGRTFSNQNPRTMLFNNGKFMYFDQSVACSVTHTDGYGKYETFSLGFSSFHVRGAAYGNGVYVAVGSANLDGTNSTNQFAHSADGFSWRSTAIGSSICNDAAFGNGVFVAVGSSNAAFTSTDGITWTSRTIGTGLWRSVIFAGGQFVAVGTNVVATSPEGITWTLRTIPAAGWTSVTHGDGLYVAVANTTNVPAIATSPDGITWTSRTVPTIGVGLGSVAFGGGLFVGIGINTTFYVVSKDGIDWYRKAASTNFSGSPVSRGLVYGNGMFLMNANTPGILIRSISETLP
jgi:hypothetical protein